MGFTNDASAPWRIALLVPPGGSMAEFNIKHQQAHNINQGDVVYVGVALDEAEVAATLARLVQEIDFLMQSGSLDRGLGDEVRSSISAAASAGDKKQKLRALMRVDNIASGVAILSGVAQTVSDIISSISR
jgi:hypothetical protein